MREISMTVKHPKRKVSTPRSDMRALWGGILFSLAFTGLIWWAGQRLDSIQLLPDQGPAWYYWKLPQPTLWGRITSWGFYFLHQVAIWGLIYYAQTRIKRYTTGLHQVNVLALATNAVFILFHFIQTHIWYDGLAQDTPIWSSQGSVIIMLVWILLMENNRRGLFLGKKLPISQEIIRWARAYHGYVFAWAIIYTFWFHPMEITSGHLIGFFYMFLLMLQGSLFFTRVHLDRWWTVALEVLVLFHGALVAITNTNNLWPMFAFGFAGIFVVTQMHGLGLSLKVRGLIMGLFVASALWIYSQLGLEKIHQVTWIPAIEYLAVLLLAGLIGIGLRLSGRYKGNHVKHEQSSEAGGAAA